MHAGFLSNCRTNQLPSWTTILPRSAYRSGRDHLIRLAKVAATLAKARFPIRGRLAQLVEHLVYTERVSGSSPLAPTIFRKRPEK